MLSFLLEMPTFNPDVVKLFDWATLSDQLDVFKYLQRRYTMNFVGLFPELYSLARDDNMIKVFKHLSEMANKSPCLNMRNSLKSCWTEALQDEWWDAKNELLDQGTMLEDLGNELFIAAAWCGHIPLMNTFLRRIPNLDPLARYNIALRGDFVHDELKAIEFRCSLKQFDSFYPSNFSLEIAVKTNQPEILRYLLQQPLVRDPKYSDLFTDMLLEAAKMGSVEIVKLLLTCPGVDVREEVLREAKKGGHQDLIRFLLTLNHPNLSAETGTSQIVTKDADNTVCSCNIQ